MAKIATIYLIGIDEVGRGPLAGPVCVGGVCVLARERKALARHFRGVKESKQLSPPKRQQWFLRIKNTVWGEVVGQVSFFETATAFVGEKIIDRRGISFAIQSAIAKVLNKLELPPKQCLVVLDGGLKAPEKFENQMTIIRGDEKEWLIALASIVAKVRRDQLMSRLAKRFPNYGFEKHKGYGTREHYCALQKYGLCEIHRKSFLKNF